MGGRFATAGGKRLLVAFPHPRKQTRIAKSMKRNEKVKLIQMWKGDEMGPSKFEIEGSRFLDALASLEEP